MLCLHFLYGRWRYGANIPERVRGFTGLGVHVQQLDGPRIFPEGDYGMKPWKMSLILFIGSLVITVALWMLGLPFFFVFLFLPLFPLLKRKQTIRRCPVCGWETTGSERFCPWDATPLTGPGSEFGE